MKECRTTKHKAKLDFHVSSRADKPILGRDACEELQLVRRVEALTARSPQPGKAPATKEEMLQRYEEVFTGLGEFPGVHHIHIDPSVTPCDSCMPKCSPLHHGFTERDTQRLTEQKSDNPCQ